MIRAAFLYHYSLCSALFAARLKAFSDTPSTPSPLDASTPTQLMCSRHPLAPSSSSAVLAGISLAVYRVDLPGPSLSSCKTPDSSLAWSLDVNGRNSRSHNTKPGSRRSRRGTGRSALTSELEILRAAAALDPFIQHKGTAPLQMLSMYSTNLPSTHAQRPCPTSERARSSSATAWREPTDRQRGRKCCSCCRRQRRFP